MPERAVSLSSAGLQRSGGRCGLSLCRLVPCTLATHHAYVKRALATVHRSDRVSSSATSSSSSEQTLPTQDTESSDPRNPSFTHLTDLCTRYIERQITNGLPSIPFKTQYVSECCDLVHQYVTYQVHRRLRIYFPYVNPLAHIRSIVETTYTNPIMSIVVVANSQAHNLMSSRANAADRTTQIVYGIILREIRERITSVSPENVSWLLRLVMALVGLEFYINSPNGLKTHREAMQNLVAMQGGVDALGELRGYVLNIDRFIATCLGQYPLYKDIKNARQSTQPVERYGKAFATLAGTVDPTVIVFLEDQCRLIELLETNRVRLTDASESNPLQSIDRQKLPYFLSMREKVSADFARLHAYYHDNQVDKSDPLSTARVTSISRCVMLGGYIVWYAVTLGDYYTMMRPMIGSELECVLERRTRESWQSNEDTVIWLLFALATIPKWSRHKQVIVELHRRLSNRYIESWPQGDWMAEEARKLKDFVWCDLAFSDLYSTICEELLELEREMNS